jgi:hypothetical protein
VRHHQAPDLDLLCILAVGVRVPRRGGLH